MRARSASKGEAKPLLALRAGKSKSLAVIYPLGGLIVFIDAALLLAAARAVRLNAHAPFSHFQVGAALETSEGQIVAGCNVENATYGLTLCAERVAVFKAISEGWRQFRRVAIVADTSAPTPPCGACRQILWEFGGDLEIILGNLTAETARFQLKDLFPLPFDARLLGG